MSGLLPLGSDALGGSGVVVVDDTINESLVLTSSEKGGLAGAQTDSVAMTDSSLGGLAGNQTDSVAMTDSLIDEVDTVLREFLALNQTIDPIAHYAAAINDLFHLQDTQRLVTEETIAEILELAETMEGSPRAIVAVVDAMVMTGAVSNTLAAMGVVIEVLALRDALRLVQDGTISEALDFVEALTERLTALEALVVEAVFGDQPTAMASVVVQVSDQASFIDDLDPRVAFIGAIQDGLDFAVGFVFDDTPYLALSLNTATRGVTTYSNFAFDSLAAFGRNTYAAGDGGLYRLGGTDDAGTPIVWRIRTGMSNLGTNRQKGLDAAYLGYTATGRIHLKCIVVAPDGRKIAHWYELTPQGAASPRAGRIPTGRGLRSVYWGFELTNLDEGDVDLDTLELHPVIFEGRLP